MDRTSENCCIAVFDCLERVTEAVAFMEGRSGGISLIYRSGGLLGYFRSNGCRGFMGADAALWNGLCQADTASALVWLPSLGLIVVVGPFVDVFMEAMEEGTGLHALGPLGEALYCLNVPQGSIERYEAALKEARCLLMVQGSQDEVAQVHDRLAPGCARDLAIHLA